MTRAVLALLESTNVSTAHEIKVSSVRTSSVSKSFLNLIFHILVVGCPGHARKDFLNKTNKQKTNKQTKKKKQQQRFPFFLPFFSVLDNMGPNGSKNSKNVPPPSKKKRKK